MIQGLLARQGGLHGNAQHLLELPLADVVGQAARPEAVLPQDWRLNSRCPWALGAEAWAGVVAGADGQAIAGQGLWIHEPLLQAGGLRQRACPRTRPETLSRTRRCAGLGGCVARF